MVKLIDRYGSEYAAVNPFANLATFPAIGLEGIAYVATDNVPNLAYRWDATTSAYVQIGGSAGQDFWRSTVGARLLPDGTSDTTEGILHSGAVHMGAESVAGDQGFHHEAIVSYVGNGSFQTQVIQTNIPASSTLMPAIFIKGYCYGDANTIDLQASLYTYNVPLNSILNQVWSSSGSKEPAQMRMGFIGGLLAIELTWPAVEYFNRYEVSAYCDGNGAHTAEMFQGWTVTNGVFPGAVVTPTVVPRKFGKTPDGRQAMQPRFTSQANTKISLAGQVRWNGFYHVMTAGVNAHEPGGHFRIDMPADGFAVPVADGTTRVVVAAVAGSSVDTGGILLNDWETLWYKHPKGTGVTFVPGNLLIVPYLANTNLAGPFVTPEDWIKIAARDNQNAFSLGTGDVVGLGAQVGRGGRITDDNWSALKARVMGDGYFFSPGGNTSSPLAFGFTGTIRWIGAGSTPNVNGAGYVDVSNRPVGQAVRGVNGAANRAWRLMTAAEKPGWFGGALRGVNPIVPASTTVVDLNDNETLFYVRDISSGAGQGEWVVLGYSGVVTAPAHWLPVASRQTTAAHSTIQVLLGGVQYALKAGDARYTSTNDATMDAIRRAATVQFGGVGYCRRTIAGFFAGTAANGLLGGPTGVMVSWDNNKLMYGISDGYASFGNQYTYLDVPPAGTAIPVVSTNSNITRVVQTIGGRRYIPLSVWESLYWIPPAYTGGNTASGGDWVIGYYASGNQHIPPSAVCVAKQFGDGGIPTIVNFVNGIVLSPGVALAVGTPTEYDHAQGSGDWRPVVAAGQAGPAMTGPVPAVAGIANQGAVYKYTAQGQHTKGRVELDGYIAVTANIADGAQIAFLPGMTTRSAGQLLPVVSRHAGNNTVPGISMISFNNVTIAGQQGVNVLLYGNSGGNVSNQRGGANGAGGVISLAGITFSVA